jgi:hypothetical protein
MNLAQPAHFFFFCKGEHSAENPIKRGEGGEGKDIVRSVVLTRTSALMLCLDYES